MHGVRASYQFQCGEWIKGLTIWFLMLVWVLASQIGHANEVDGPLTVTTLWQVEDLGNADSIALGGLSDEGSAAEIRVVWGKDSSNSAAAWSWFTTWSLQLHVVGATGEVEVTRLGTVPAPVNGRLYEATLIN